MADARLTPGKVAERSGVSVPTLHFYEARGLIRSWRNAGNQRRYKQDVMRRIAVIKAAQKVGISLDEIRVALGGLPDERTPTQKDWEKLSREWRRTLDAKIAYLERLRDTFTGCIGCGCLSMTNCPIYNADDKLAVEGPGAVILERAAKPAADN
ncbi:MAG: redox-sensitive transcriptional activator SoxR [Pseudomonadota bacterium]